MIPLFAHFTGFPHDPSDLALWPIALAILEVSYYLARYRAARAIAYVRQLFTR